MLRLLNALVATITLLGCLPVSAHANDAGGIKKLPEKEIKRLGDDYDKYYNKPEKLYQIGLIFERLGDYDQALGIYLDILKRFPKYGDRLYLQDRVKTLRRDQAGDYTAVLNRASQTKTSKDDFLDWRAACYSQKMPLRVYINPAKKLKGYRPRLLQILKDSFEEWTIATGNVVSFKFAGSEKEADIECFWTDRKSDLHSHAAAGITSYTSVGRSKIHVLTYSYGTPVSTRFAKHCCLHEIGHALGLTHTRNPEDVMCGFSPEGLAPIKLSKLDIDRCLKIYSKAPLFVPKLQSFIKKSLLYSRYVAKSKKNYKEAIKELDDIFDIDRNNVDAIIQRSKIYTRMELYDQAEVDLTRALRLAPDRARAILPQRALVNVFQKKYDMASIDFNAAIEANYVNPGVYGGLALSRVLSSNDLNVLAELDEAIRRSRFDPQLRRARSLIRILRSDLHAAIDDSKQYLALSCWRDSSVSAEQALMLSVCKRLVDNREDPVVKDDIKKHSRGRLELDQLHRLLCGDQTVLEEQGKADRSKGQSNVSIWCALISVRSKKELRSERISSWLKTRLEDTLYKICLRSFENSF